MKKYNFMPKMPYMNFQTKWGVYLKGGHNSFCYTTDKARAWLISIALNRFLNSQEGQEWVEKNIIKKGY